MNIKFDPETRLYRALRWIAQPIKETKVIYQEIRYQPLRKAKLLEFQNSQKFAGLNIGCGPFYLVDWVNTDILGSKGIDFPLDISKKLPIADNFFDAIYGQEVIEHIELKKARLFFQEAFRVLKPGGVIRLTTPDLTEVCKIFLGQHKETTVNDYKEGWYEGDFSKEIWINAMFRSWGHQHLWTFESLADELRKVGFVQTQRCEKQQTKSDKPQLNNLENRYGEDLSSPWFAATMIVESSKP
jgi:predicted SAM-dependent methyltransferase